MARQRMVTRTIEQTTATIMCLDVTTAEVQVRDFTIGGNFDAETLLKKFKAIYETDTYKLVHIERVHMDELLLGMTEDDFIRYAKVLPPRSGAKDTEAEE